MQALNLHIETCPCPVCRSDMAYIYPCESPVIIMTEMEIVPVDIPESSPPVVSATVTTVPSRSKKVATKKSV